MMPLAAILACVAVVFAADPKCQTGILEESALVCCAKECGVCGGPSCGSLPGGSKNCCVGTIKDEHRPCSSFDPPCVVAESPIATACGDYPAALSASQPNVLLIGDSISMPPPYTPGGYGADARAMLTNHSINVWHNGGWKKGGQASNTVKGLKCTDSSTAGNWMNVSGTYDVIHFNFGLHDLVDPGPGEGKEHVNLPQYGINLADIFKVLARKAHHVIFATTTPCPNVTTSMGRSDAKVQAYNSQALESLKEAAGDKLIVDDLHSAVISYCGVDYKTCDLQLPANVHFEPKGCQFLANKVVASILSVLQM